MNENKKRLIHRIYSTVLAAMLIALGICFIISCACVFSEENIERLASEGRYTGDGLREEIGGALLRLICPSAIALAMIIGTPILNHLLPLTAEKLKAAPDEDAKYSIAKRRAKDALYDSETVSAIMRERRLRLIFTLSGIGLFIISLIYPIIRMLDSETFTALGNANEEVLSFSLVLLAFLTPSAVYAFVIGILFASSKRREGKLLRMSAEDGSPLPPPPAAAVWLRTNSALIGRIAATAILALSMVFIILGIVNGGMADVLDKAAKICRECIGLG